jgi:hypothetical protein
LKPIASVERVEASAELGFDWVTALSARDPAAIERLHELLLRAARFEIARRRQLLPHLRGDDWDDLAQQSADDALVAVLRKLPGFAARAASRRGRTSSLCSRPR